MTKLMQISSKVDQDLDELAKITGMSRQILLEKALSQEDKRGICCYKGSPGCMECHDSRTKSLGYNLE